MWTSTASTSGQNKILLIFAKWILTLQSSLEALCDATRAISKYSDNMQNLSPDATGIALVMFNDETDIKHIDLVQWTTRGCGRVADIDESGHMITIVPSGKKRIPIDFRKQGGIVLHPSTSLRMERQKKKDRAKIPPNILQLRDIWKIATADSPEDLFLQWQSHERVEGGSNTELQTLLTCSDTECIFCGSTMHLQCSDAKPNFILRCCMCFTSMHKQCNTTVQQLIVSQLIEGGIDASSMVCSFTIQDGSQRFIHTSEQCEGIRDNVPFPLPAVLQSRPGYDDL